MGKKGGAHLPDLETLIKAGIDPQTKLPIKITSSNMSRLDIDIRKMLRIIDEQDAVNRYVWTNLPTNITGQELERLIYYKGQLVFFYEKDTGKFYFMPYALDGTIDFYGRFNTVHPVPMTEGQEMDEEGKKLRDMQSSILSNIKLNCVYGVVDEDEITAETLTNSGVLLYDYSKQMSETLIPRWLIQEPLLNFMSECIPYMRTSLIAGAGVKGMRVGDADSQAEALEASKSIEKCAKSGQLYVPMVGAIEFQELTNGEPTKSEEFMIAMQSLDNLRKSAYGIENSGLFEKKAHMLESENDMNTSSAMNQFQDGLSIRQNFCNIVNSIWDLGIWCEPSENVVMMDMDGDGKAFDENDNGDTSSVENDTTEDEE